VTRRWKELVILWGKRGGRWKPKQDLKIPREVLRRILYEGGGTRPPTSRRGGRGIINEGGSLSEKEWSKQQLVVGNKKREKEGGLPDRWRRVLRKKANKISGGGE